MLRSPEQKAKWAAYMRKWNAANHDRILAAARRRYASRSPLERIERDRRYNAKKRASYRLMVDNEKAHPCLDCGERFPPECMDFDHVRGEKLFQIGQMGQRNKESLLAELAKCDLVCSNCHRIRTRARKQHGYGRKPRAA